MLVLRGGGLKSGVNSASPGSPSVDPALARPPGQRFDGTPKRNDKTACPHDGGAQRSRSPDRMIMAERRS